MPTPQRFPEIRTKYEALDFRKFSGYNVRDSDINVDDDELTEGRNVDISVEGSISKRKGHTLYGNLSGSSTGILGLFAHEPAGGTPELLRVYHTSLERYVAGTWTPLTSVTMTTALQADAAYFPLTAKTYVVNGTDNVVKYASGSSGDQTDSAFKKGTYIVHYKNRLLTSVSDTVWYTDLGVDTFSSNNYLRAPRAVTGLKVFYDKLLTFTRREVFVTQNFSFNGVAAGPESFLPLRTAFGAVYERTVVTVNNLCYFLGQDSQGLCAVYATDGLNVQIVSDKVRNDLNLLASSQLGTACAGAWGRFYRLSVPASGQTSNTLEYLYDTVSRRWFPPYSNQVGGFSCYATFEGSGRQELYAGTQGSGQTYKLNQADYDENAPERCFDASNADKAVDANPAVRAAMSFRLSDYPASEPVPLTSVFLRLKKNAGTTTDLQVRIETDNSGKPSGVPVANGTATVAAFSSTSYAYRRADFSSCALAGSTRYWIVLQHAAESSGDSQYYWSGNSSAPTYSDGNLATFVTGALSADDSFSPDPNPESSSFDGVVFRAVDASPETFSAIRGASTGTGSASSTTMIPNLIAGTSSGTYVEMGRAVVAFDTSSMPDDAVVTAATLQVYVQFVSDDFSQSLGVGSASTSADDGLAAADYAVGNFGSARYATDKPLSSLATNAYASFPLNATGMSSVDPAGTTKMALRLSGDMDGSPPSWTSGGQSAAVLQTAENPSSHPPVLTVSYTTSSGTGTWTSDPTTDQNFAAYVQGAIDGYGATKAFFLAPQGQRAYLRDLFVTADAPGDWDLEVGVKSGTYDAYSTADMNLSGGAALWGSTFVWGTSSWGAAARTETRLRFRASRTRTATFRFRNAKANQPFTVYGFRTAHEVLPKIK